MAKYTKTVDVFTLSEAQRAALQPGQHISAGPAHEGAFGRYMGQKRGGTDVVAWRKNTGAMMDRMQTLRAYAKGN